MFKKLLFTLFLMLNTNLAMAAGLITDTDLFTCNGSTCNLKYGMVLSGSGLTVGSSIITGGTTGYLLYNNGGVLGNLNPAGLTLAWSQITSTPTTIVGYGLTDAANISFTNVTGTLPIVNGGTNATTANAALNNLLPSQTGNALKVLQTNGTSTAWGTSGSSSFTSRASAYLSNSGTVPSGAFTLIPYDAFVTGFGSTTEFDITTNKGRFTSTSGGVYQVNATVELGVGETAIFAANACIFKNGTIATCGTSMIGPPDFTSNVYTGVSYTIHLNASDYIEIKEYQTGANSDTLYATSYGTNVQITQIQ